MTEFQSPHGQIDWRANTPALRRAFRRLFGKRVRLMVPTIRQGLPAVEQMVGLRTQIPGPYADVAFDFTNCWDVPPIAIAYLGGLARLIERSSGSVSFEWQTCTPRVLNALTRSGFVGAFGGADGERDPHTIPFRQDIGTDVVSVGRYLRESWLSEQWIALTPALREALVSIVIEIYLNAFEHGASPVGVLTCGRHNERTRTLKLTVMDFGVGIPHNVRVFTKRPALRASTAMKWAFEPGTTTKPVPDTVRGIGLDLLKEFVRLNKGELRIVSEEAMAVVRPKTERFTNHTSRFHGTLVDITFRCDDALYGFASEMGEQPPLFR